MRLNTFVCQSEGRNGLWQSLGAWVVLGLVLGAGLFAHGAAHSYSMDLAGSGMYSKAFCISLKRLEPSRTLFQNVVCWGLGIGCPDVQKGQGSQIPQKGPGSQIP